MEQLFHKAAPSAEEIASYRNASPFPHIMLDNFLPEQVAQETMEAFPNVSDEGWIHYVHFNEKKHGLNKVDMLPGPIQSLIHNLNSPEFVEWLSQLTGIEGLMADPAMEGGGLHQSLPGGFLNIHADFTVHPHHRNWRRRVNLLLYFNKDWLPSYAGDLELWARDMSQCEQKIAPIFNRCVIFNTDEDSYHGLPDPIKCPEGMARKSVALYYFTEEAATPTKRTTNYQARPQDSSNKATMIWLDKHVVSLYSRIKSVLGINDDFVSKVLNLLGKKK